MGSIAIGSLPGHETDDAVWRGRVVHIGIAEADI